MNEVLKKITEMLKKPKLLILLGVIGIILLIFSSLTDFGNNDTAKQKNNTKTDFTEVYLEKLENDIARIVEGISGDKKSTVVITLESGIYYNYADSLDISSTNSLNDNSQNESNSSSKTYITVQNNDGGEEPLIISEIMPEVRGVAIVCNGGDDEATAEKIKNAVTAALNITSKRVYIVGGNNNEKR